jgi:NADPH-dependent F420 reductase
MNIAIIGTGNVGAALAGSHTRAGRHVTVTSRNTAQAGEVAEASGAGLASSPSEAVEQAQVVVLAVPFSEAEDVARDIAPVAAGRAVVDATNPLTPDYDGLVTDGGPSGAERIQRLLPGAHVVKAFNTVFASVQADPTVHGEPVDAFVAADDAMAKAAVLELAGDIGLNPVDAGPLRNAAYLEALAFLNINLQGTLGQTWKTAWKLVGAPEDSAAAA